MRYPDRPDNRRASLFWRRGALCTLACVVQGISCVHNVGFRVLQCMRHTSTTLSSLRYLGSADRTPLYMKYAPQKYAAYGVPHTDAFVCFTVVSQ
jgi:hypothetical protein